jgi:hypothetical protein
LHVSPSALTSAKSAVESACILIQNGGVPQARPVMLSTQFMLCAQSGTATAGYLALAWVS